MHIKRLIVLIELPIILMMSVSAFARPLNPSRFPLPSESLLDRYFRIAFDSATSADFDTAIINYQRAMDISPDKCDRQHAAAGIRSAKEAKQILRTRGIKSKPTQHFAWRLQKLTSSLPCVTVTTG